MEPAGILKTAATGLMSAIKLQTVAESGENATHTYADVETVLSRTGKPFTATQVMRTEKRFP